MVVSHPGIHLVYTHTHTGMPPLLYTALLASRVGDALTVALDMPMVGPWDPLTAPFHIIPHATHLLTMRIHKISTARGGPHNAGELRW